MVTIDDENFITEVIDAELPVLVDCWADWCGPCKMLAPELDALAEEQAGRLKVAKLNVDEHPGLAQLLAVSLLPTMVLFVEGVAQVSVPGFRHKDEILNAIEHHLKGGVSG